jgi:hypothetical protein
VGFVKPAPKALHDEARYSTTCHYTESPDGPQATHGAVLSTSFASFASSTATNPPSTSSLERLYEDQEAECYENGSDFDDV